VRVGIPTEVEDNEYRVAITPSGVHELAARALAPGVNLVAGDVVIAPVAEAHGLPAVDPHAVLP
jgi:alanine dehydrogenase